MRSALPSTPPSIASAVVTISKEPEVRRFRRQLGVILCFFIAIGPAVGLPASAKYFADGDSLRGIGWLAYVGIMAYFGGSLYWYSHNYGVEERRLTGRFLTFSSTSPSSPFSTTRGLMNTVRTRDGQSFSRVRIRDGYILRIGLRTRLPFDPKDVIEVE